MTIDAREKKSMPALRKARHGITMFLADFYTQSLK